MDTDFLALSRLANSGLYNHFETLEECVDSLAGIQAQAHNFAELSVFNRTKGLTRELLDSAYAGSDFVRAWGQRMTIHMYTPADWLNIRSIYSQRPDYITKWWADKDDDLAKVLKEIEKMFASNESLTTEEISAAIAKTVPHIDHPYRDTSIIMKATHDGILFCVPKNPQTEQYRRGDVCHKGGGKVLPPLEEALKSIMRKYFRYYAPASFRDFIHWSGMTNKETLDIFRQIEDEFVRLQIGKTVYYYSPEAFHPGNIDPGKGKVLMPGKFDPLFVAYADKTWIATPSQQKEVWRPAGHVEAVIICGGRLYGTWRYVLKGKNIAFNIYNFTPLSKKIRTGVEKEVLKLSGFMGRTLTEINYAE